MQKTPILCSRSIHSTWRFIEIRYFVGYGCSWGLQLFAGLKLVILTVRAARCKLSLLQKEKSCSLDCVRKILDVTCIALFTPFLASKTALHALDSSCMGGDILFIFMKVCEGLKPFSGIISTNSVTMWVKPRLQYFSCLLKEHSTADKYSYPSQRRATRTICDGQCFWKDSLDYHNVTNNTSKSIMSA